LILDNLGRLVEPLQKPGYEELSFMEDDCVVDLFTKADARSITDYLGRSGRT
jgi:hypothetical protein